MEICRNPLAQEQKVTPPPVTTKVETKVEAKTETKVEIQPKTEPQPKPKESDNTMKEIIVQLKNPTKIDFIITNTGERNTRMVHESKFILTKHVLFKIPLTDKTLNYSNANLIRLVTPQTENIKILDIVNGVATIEPVIHGSFVEDGQLLGYLY